MFPRFPSVAVASSLPRVPFAKVGEAAAAMMTKTMMMNLFIVREYYGGVVCFWEKNYGVESRNIELNA